MEDFIKNTVEQNPFVPAPKGKLYGEFDENHRLIVKNQVEAFEEGLPAVEFDIAYDGTLWENGFAPSAPLDYRKEQIKIKRQYRYTQESDPLKLDYDEALARGNSEEAERLRQEWLDAKDKIREELPYE